MSEHMDRDTWKPIFDKGYTLVVEGEDARVSAYLKYGDKTVAEVRKHDSYYDLLPLLLEKFQAWEKVQEDDEIFQESPRKKASWLEEAQKRIPVGTRVRVVASDVEEYIGATGVVRDHDTGVDGEWPLVSVTFDTPIKHSGSANPTEHDGFYCDGASDDEIVPLGVE